MVPAVIDKRIALLFKLVTALPSLTDATQVSVLRIMLLVSLFLAMRLKNQVEV